MSVCTLQANMKFLSSGLYLSGIGSVAFLCKKTIKKELNNLVNMIILAPKIFTVDGLTDGLKVTIKNLKDYIEGFETNFTESENNKEGDAESKKQKSINYR